MKRDITLNLIQHKNNEFCLYMYGVVFIICKRGGRIALDAESGKTVKAHWYTLRHIFSKGCKVLLTKQDWRSTSRSTSVVIHSHISFLGGGQCRNHGKSQSLIDTVCIDWYTVVWAPHSAWSLWNCRSGHYRVSFWRWRTVLKMPCNFDDSAFLNWCFFLIYDGFSGFRMSIL